MDNSNALMMGSIGKMLGDYGGNPGKGMDWGGPLNTMTQLMVTKSFRDMVAQVLGPDGTSMKLGKGGIDLSGFTPEMLSKILAGGGGENNPESFYKEIGAMGTPPKVSSMGGGSSVASPFGQDQSVSNTDFLSGDLAGLSPEHIATIMGIKLKKDELGQKKISDVMDMLYKGAGIRNMESEITARGLPKDERTAEIKNYEYAKANGFEGSIVDFKNEASTSYQKEYQQAVDEGYPKKSFNKWLGWRLRQGATIISLGEKLKEETAKSELQGQKYFNDPKSTEDLNKHMSSPGVLDVISSVPGKGAIYEANKADATAGEKVKWYRDKIIAGSGTIQSAKLIGKTMVWTVKWKNGTTSEVKRVVRP